MTGAKEFTSRGFELDESHKGRKAWTKFIDRLKLEQYEKCNSYTMDYSLNRSELQRLRCVLPPIGTQEFNSLKHEKIVLDMENRFESGEIRRLSENV